MPPIKVDFKYIRQNADFETVLSHYGLEGEKDGHKDGQFKALCPFHDDTKPSLKVNTIKNIYHCFACDAGGNILEFVQEMENENLRKAAIVLADISGIKTAENATARKAAKPIKLKGKKQKKKMKNVDAPASDDGLEEDGNPTNTPLTFELKNLETDHPFFEERDITPEMVETFGLGIATRGLMKNRMVIPIHDAEGELIAYCGRWPSNDIPEGEAKYMLPKGFHKEVELFNLHRQKKPVETIILVESYFSVFKLHMLDYPVISPMGRSLSEKQIELMNDAGTKNVVLMFDGDDPGRTAVATVGRQLLAAGFEVTAPVVPEDFKPHRVDNDELFLLVNES